MHPHPPAKPPVFPLPDATVSSCGYRHFGLEWSKHKHINELSQELLTALGKQSAVVMECLAFHDKRTDCPGVNAEVMHRIASSWKFKEWMRATKAIIMREVQIKRVDNPGGVPNVEIVMVCRSGKHRSVACAELTAFVLRHLRWTVSIEHIHDEHWGRWCKGGCNRCQKCSHVKKDAFDLALTTWHSV